MTKVLRLLNAIMLIMAFSTCGVEQRESAVEERQESTLSSPFTPSVLQQGQPSAADPASAGTTLQCPSGAGQCSCEPTCNIVGCVTPPSACDPTGEGCRGACFLCLTRHTCKK